MDSLHSWPLIAGQNKNSASIPDLFLLDNWIYILDMTRWVGGKSKMSSLELE